MGSAIAHMQYPRGERSHLMRSAIIHMQDPRGGEIALDDVFAAIANDQVTLSVDTRCAHIETRTGTHISRCTDTHKRHTQYMTGVIFTMYTRVLCFILCDVIAFEIISVIYTRIQWWGLIETQTQKYHTNTETHVKAQPQTDTGRQMHKYSRQNQTHTYVHTRRHTDNITSYWSKTISIQTLNPTNEFLPDFWFIKSTNCLFRNPFNCTFANLSMWTITQWIPMSPVVSQPLWNLFLASGFL